MEHNSNYQNEKKRERREGEKYRDQLDSVRDEDVLLTADVGLQLAYEQWA